MIPKIQHDYLVLNPRQRSEFFIEISENIFALLNLAFVFKIEYFLLIMCINLAANLISFCRFAVINAFCHVIVYTAVRDWVEVTCNNRTDRMCLRISVWNLLKWAHNEVQAGKLYVSSIVIKNQMSGWNKDQMWFFQFWFLEVEFIWGYFKCSNTSTLRFFINLCLRM